MAPPNSDFEKLLEQSFEDQAPELEPGARTQGKVVEIIPEYVFIHFGGKREGLIPAEEFKNENDDIQVNIGDTLTAYYLGETDGEMLFTARPGMSQVNPEILRYLFQNNQPVFGRVTAEIKGGFTVAVGNAQAFCPFSQISLGRSDEEYIGKAFSFSIVEYNPKFKKLTVSRRPLLEEAQEKNIEKLSGTLEEGQTLTVEVKAVKPFGALAELADGIQGLIPTSELSHQKFGNPEDVISVGDQVEVKVLKIDWADQRFTLSRKAVMRDPWYDQINFNEGDILKGKVTNIKKFGVFVNIGGDVEGLVPGAETGFGRDAHLDKKFSPGQDLTVMVLNIDKDRKRISLSVRRAKENADRQEMNAYMEQQNSKGGGQNLGDLLRKSMKE